MMQSDLGPGRRGSLTAAQTIPDASPDGGRSAAAIALARPPKVQAPPDLMPEEWDELFEAVRARLERAVAALPVPGGDPAAAQAGIGARECVEALGQLQMLRVPEREQRRRIELQVLDLRRALALAIAELADLAARKAAPAGAPMPTTNDR